MPLSSAALEKLRRPTMSQKIFRDRRFMFMESPRKATQEQSFRLVPDEKSQ